MPTQGSQLTKPSSALRKPQVRILASFKSQQIPLGSHRHR